MCCYMYTLMFHGGSVPCALLLYSKEVSENKEVCTVCNFFPLAFFYRLPKDWLALTGWNTWGPLVCANLFKVCSTWNVASKWGHTSFNGTSCSKNMYTLFNATSSGFEYQDTTGIPLFGCGTKLNGLLSTKTVLWNHVSSTNVFFLMFPFVLLMICVHFREGYLT